MTELDQELNRLEMSKRSRMMSGALVDSSEINHTLLDPNDRHIFGFESSVKFIKYE